MKTVIIGAGAAGCFCAVNLKRFRPEAEVVVLEALARPLAKVAITGGGRCNLTNSFEDITALSQAYPRGDRLMKRALSAFSQNDTWDWWEREGVRLVLQEDRCVFPRSQDAMQIVNTLLRDMDALGIRIHTRCKVQAIERDGEGFVVRAGGDGGSAQVFHADKVVVTTGGSPKAEGLSFLDGLSLEIVAPIPSLFTFNISGQGLNDLLGTVVENALLRIPGTGFSASGPLLLTHWGCSGPATLKLSSYAARYLADNAYHCRVAVSWLGDDNEDRVREAVQGLVRNGGGKLCSSLYPETLTARLWAHILKRAALRDDMRWSELGRKGINRLTSVLAGDVYDVRGKSRFKEEFVTCGGVALSEINMNTMESRRHPGLYFAGEVLDVDAITGGFNLQAAWSMGWCIAKALSRV